MANTPRVVTGPNQDTTGRTITMDYQAIAYASSIALTTTAQNTTVKVGALTGISTITAAITNALIGDKIDLLFIGDSVDRVITFSTGFGGITTLTVPGNGSVAAKFTFNGAVWVFATSGTYVTTVTDVQSPAYASTISVTTTARSTKVVPAQLTGAATINMVTTSALKGDSLEFLFAADGTNRTVTFGTGLKSSGTLTVTASKFAGIRFGYDGTEWIATGREITA